MLTLGIETSCDETAVALYDSEEGLVGESVFSQIDMHAEYGGVVPELASRDHCLKIISVLEDALGARNISEIDQIAYTSGPGLLGALLVGESFAHGLSAGLGKPTIPVHHLEAHLMAPALDFDDIGFPFISLLVSGGHSLIIDVKGLGDYTILGESQDDAVGEAFDKVGKLLNLPYPGGPHIERIARNGDPKKFNYPRPMMHSDNLNLSFSGLKTAVLYSIRDLENLDEHIPDIAASFQRAAIDVLVSKIKKSLTQTNRDTLILAGGVAANGLLRDEMSKLEDELNIKVRYPAMKHCTDNAAMIAYLGSLKTPDMVTQGNSNARPRWPLNEV
ncbi:MAG: tRNA (adenosine(37)-N6)-threonylcarbamoyltransferase complex transferase subunit TsaD [SAR86 cluster bacterium]|uniref:tRNA N6-adenosine threonylcarbamoyltransferase n=1 Tax=SAR86 cluster bacterium TaxID=2030880 RepID=A0A937M0C8_9GAMM|nr:tRNA (adenosine(37)-N6)-threonylcarbamoyltransferase complex transferase subunit TsaD [SAR86 cluster bacterium]